METVLFEASGSLAAIGVQKSAKEAGYKVVASDSDALSVGRHFSDAFHVVPETRDSDLWPALAGVIKQEKVSLVVPSLDESLLLWDENRESLRDQGVHVCLSSRTAIETFSDKWLAFEFFRQQNLPTPLTSLTQDYALIKPRVSRGSRGVHLADEPTDMQGRISQEFCHGQEFTVDVLCDAQGKPVYIVPRRREKVLSGKSIVSTVDVNADIVALCERICATIDFFGPINIQIFLDETPTIIEINPRLASGAVLAFAATENWIPLMHRIAMGEVVSRSSEVQNGLRMERYFSEHYVLAAAENCHQ